jgi:hypothetical protein
MRKFRAIIAILALALTIYTITEINYKDLSWHVNKGNYLGIISMTYTFIAMILTNISETAQREKF